MKRKILNSFLGLFVFLLGVSNLGEEYLYWHSIAVPGWVSYPLVAIGAGMLAYVWLVKERQ